MYPYNQDHDHANNKTTKKKRNVNIEEQTFSIYLKSIKNVQLPGYWTAKDGGMDRYLMLNGKRQSLSVWLKIIKKIPMLHYMLCLLIPYYKRNLSKSITYVN